MPQQKHTSKELILKAPVFIDVSFNVTPNLGKQKVTTISLTGVVTIIFFFFSNYFTTIL